MIILRVYIVYLIISALWYAAKIAMGWPVDLGREVEQSFFIGVGMAAACAVMRIENWRRPS